MANATDSALALRLVALAESGQKKAAVMALLAAQDLFIDDAAYWCIVGALWVHQGEMVHSAYWRRLFESRRPRRDKIMKGSDRRTWKALPASVRAYRAAKPGELEAWSWTLKRATAERFAKAWERVVLERVFQRRDILAFFGRRGEDEIVVLPGMGRR